MHNIQLVDCTLRDGGHINQSRFGAEAIRGIIHDLILSKVDLIELGFLRDCRFDSDIAIYDYVKEAKSMISHYKTETKFCLLVQEDQYDVSKLEQNDGVINDIRVSFHNYDFNQGIDFCRQVIEKGYNCHVNPINLLGYTDAQLIDIIYIINNLNPYAFTIVDTFGSMVKSDLIRVYSIIENNLDPNILIGLHLHENLSLSYSLAQAFMEIKNPKRNVLIDGSLYGMGRVPGNLCIELIMDYLNTNYNANYETASALDAIDNYIIPIKNKIPWGYSIAYSLSAKYSLHRTYAEFLLGKGRLKTKDIQRILGKIKDSEKSIYNENYIQALYMDYINVKIDDRQDIQALRENMASKECILIIAPGSSINDYHNQLIDFINQKDPCIISVNFQAEKIGIKNNYLFYTNIKRFEQIEETNAQIIITSNLLNYSENHSYALNYNDLIYFNETISDNSTLMLLSLMKRFNIDTVFLAGFDGYKEKDNFFDPIYEKDFPHNEENLLVKQILDNYFNPIQINMLTPSLYFNKSI